MQVLQNLICPSSLVALGYSKTLSLGSDIRFRRVSAFPIFIAHGIFATVLMPGLTTID